jgi:hypothetical protein
VDGACGTRGRGEKSVQGFGGKSQRKETTWKTKVQMGEWHQNGSYKLERLAGGVEWIQLNQDRGEWRDVVSAVINLRFLTPRNEFSGE